MKKVKEKKRYDKRLYNYLKEERGDKSMKLPKKNC